MLRGKWRGNFVQYLKCRFHIYNMYARVRNIHWWYDDRKRKVTYSARFISDLRGFSSCSAKFSNIWVMWSASRNCLQNMWQSYYLTTHAVSQTWNQDWILDWNVSAMLQSFPWQRLNSGQSTSTGGLCQSTDYDCTVHRHCLPCRAFFAFCLTSLPSCWDIHDLNVVSEFIDRCISVLSRSPFYWTWTRISFRNPFSQTLYRSLLVFLMYCL